MEYRCSDQSIPMENYYREKRSVGERSRRSQTTDVLIKYMDWFFFDFDVEDQIDFARTYNLNFISK